MPIRFVKSRLSISCKGKSIIDEVMGAPIITPELVLDDPKDVFNTKISLTNPNDNPTIDGLWEITHDELTHVGRVVDIIVKYTVRIMSDVWADLTFAVVYEPNGHEGSLGNLKFRAAGEYKPKMFRTIQIGNSEFPSTGRTDILEASIDAPEWLLDVYCVAQAGKDFKTADIFYEREQKCIVSRRQEVQKGIIVRVVRAAVGCKVPLGTEGKIFWKGNSSWGEKVGIAVPQKDGSYRIIEKTDHYGRTYENFVDVVWTYVKNVERIQCIGGKKI